MARFAPRALAIVVALYTTATAPAKRSSLLSVDVGAKLLHPAAEGEAETGAAGIGTASAVAVADPDKAKKGAADAGKPTTAAAAADMGQGKMGAVNTNKAKAGAAADAGNANAGAAPDLGKPKKDAAAGVGNGRQVVPSATMLAAANGDPHSLARVLGGRVKAEGSAQINVIGPSASYVALRALVIACKDLRKDFPGKVLAAVPSKREATLKDGSKTVGYSLDVRAVPVVGVEKPVAVFDGDADAGLLPGFMSRLKKQDELSVGAMGSKAVYRVMRATVIAQAILEKEHEADESELALVPSFTKFRRHGKKMSRMLFVCVRTAVDRASDAEQPTRRVGCRSETAENVGAVEETGRPASVRTHADANSAGDGIDTENEFGGSLIVRPPYTVSAIAHLGERLRNGNLVAFPTETVYGLGANGLDATAVLKIFEAKGRPLNDPCILHVPSIVEARELVDFSAPLERAVFDHLAGAFWPGPLSIVTRASAKVPRVVTAGTEFVAVRIPSHPVALMLLQAAKVPVAAPSANRFGHVSPTCADHVAADLGHVEGLRILDGGSCGVGIESTVVKLDIANHRVVVLRKGGTTGEQLERALAQGAAAGVFGSTQVRLEFYRPHHTAASPASSEGEAEDSKPQQAPGMMVKHYAPSLPTFLISARVVESGNAASAESSTEDIGDPSHAVLIDIGSRMLQHHALFLRTFDLALSVASDAVASVPTSEGGFDVEEACRRVFATLRDAEAFAESVGAKAICIVDFSAGASVRGSLEEALHDRLFRAASGQRLDVVVSRQQDRSPFAVFVHRPAMEASSGVDRDADVGRSNDLVNG